MGGVRIIMVNTYFYWALYTVVEKIRATFFGTHWMDVRAKKRTSWLERPWSLFGLSNGFPMWLTVLKECSEDERMSADIFYSIPTVCNRANLFSLSSCKTEFDRLRTMGGRRRFPGGHSAEGNRFRRVTSARPVCGFKPVDAKRRGRDRTDAAIDTTSEIRHRRHP